MRILAVDLGSVGVGWSYFEAERDRAPRLIGVGTWNIVPKAGQSYGVRWLRLDAALEAVLTVSGLEVDLVCYEEVRRHRGVKAAHAYGASLGTLERWCASRGIEYLGIAVSQIKTAAVGKGGGKGTGKLEVYEAAQSRWPGHDFPDDNASDAAFLGLACIQQLNLCKAEES